MSAAVVWAFALVFIVAIVVVGVYFIARMNSDQYLRIQEQDRDIRAQAAVIQEKQQTINKRDIEISQLKIDLQTERNRIHDRDQAP